MPVAKRKTLFDDRPVEISVCSYSIWLRCCADDSCNPQELTYIIKQDIANINKQIAHLQTYVKQRNASNSKSPEGKQLDEHNHNVVMLLQSKLADTSMSFKDVLEIRTQVSKPKAHSSCMLTFNASEHEGVERSNGAVHALDLSCGRPSTFKSVICTTVCTMIPLLTFCADSLLFGNTPRQDPMGDGTAASPRFDSKGKGRATPRPDNDILALDLGAAEEGVGGNGDAFMQMQLVEQQVRGSFTSSTGSLTKYVMSGQLHPITVNSDRVY